MKPNVNFKISLTHSLEENGEKAVLYDYNDDDDGMNNEYDDNKALSQVISIIGAETDGRRSSDVLPLFSTELTISFLTSKNCPALQRGLTCGKYNVYHYHRQCSIATIYCRRNLTNVREVAVYVAATGTDLNKNKSGLFVLPYLDRKDLFVPLLVVEKPHHGNGGKGELVCGSNGKWILYDINYRYEVEHLFCLVVEARNLNYLMDLAHPELKRVTPVVPFRRNDPEFFEFAK
uniref:Uncharacterized protein n=1 Tax=Setaria digitata TaxID=48799 RepID=A0A915PDR2_9BILA